MDTRSIILALMAILGGLQGTTAAASAGASDSFPRAVGWVTIGWGVLVAVNALSGRSREGSLPHPRLLAVTVGVLAIVTGLRLVPDEGLKNGIDMLYEIIGLATMVLGFICTGYGLK